MSEGATIHRHYQDLNTTKYRSTSCVPTTKTGEVYMHTKMK